MAEAVFRDYVAHPSHPLIRTIDSAGTAAYHTGSSPDHRTMKTLKANSVHGYKHQARKVSPEDFETFDWIFAMDSDNLEDLESMRDRTRKKKGLSREVKDGEKGHVALFGDFGGRKGEEVVDPYYGADNGFDVAYEQMVRFSKGFMRVFEGREE